MSEAPERLTTDDEAHELVGYMIEAARRLDMMDMFSPGVVLSVPIGINGKQYEFALKVVHETGKADVPPA